MELETRDKVLFVASAAIAGGILYNMHLRRRIENIRKEVRQVLMETIDAFEWINSEEALGMDPVEMINSVTTRLQFNKIVRDV